MRRMGSIARGVVALVVAATPVLATTTSSSAAPPPPDPVPVSLTCEPGTYSYVQVLNLLDRKGNIVGVENLECGAGWDTYYPVPFAYPSSVSATVSARQVTGYSYLDWTCANTSDPIGGSAALPGYSPLAKKGPTTLRCPVPGSTTGSDVTLTIG